jgi:hypothetical protein
MDSLPDRKRFLLAAVAFVAGGAVPIQLVTLSFGYAQYVKGVEMGPRTFAVAHEFASIYIPFVFVPAMVALLAIAIYGRAHYPDLTRRIVVGFSMGVIATLALDAVRQAGVINGWLPGDTPIMFGKMATGSPDFVKIYSAGLLVHYLNGANFGLFYAFVWGKRSSYRSAAIWATFWALLLEIGMMTGPPMAKMVGMFGYNWAWPQLFELTFLAHVVFGIALGLLIQHFLKDEDSAWLWPFLKGQPGSGGIAAK